VAIAFNGCREKSLRNCFAQLTWAEPWPSFCDFLSGFTIERMTMTQQGNDTRQAGRMARRPIRTAAEVYARLKGVVILGGAVRPSELSEGIGRSLLLSLASARPERTAVLSTADAPTRARRLYRGLGFTDLLTDFKFSGSEPPYAVMGAPLPLPATVTLPRSPRPSNW